MNGLAGGPSARPRRERPRTAATLAAAVTAALAAPASAAPGSWAWAVGVMAHDRGFASDDHEDGVDLNLEVQFAPLAFPGSPRPHLGATLNFNGDTSVAYAGLGFRVWDAARWFADANIGAVVHDGPLHKDPVRCEQFSDCGFGTRYLPRLGAEIGYRLSPRASIGLFYDHMSHKWVVEGENEGLDHIGVRYLRAF